MKLVFGTNSQRGAKMRPVLSNLGGLAALLGSVAHAQLSTSNCIVMGPNMVHCDTMDMSTPSTPQTGPDSGTQLGTALGQLISGTSDQHVRSNVGRMLAAGNCDGAYQYALQKGRFDLASRVRDLCATGSVSAQAYAAPIAPVVAQKVDVSGAHRVRAKTPSGYCLDVPNGYVGTGAENSPAVSSAMPRCDQLSAH